MVIRKRTRKVVIDITKPKRWKVNFMYHGEIVSMEVHEGRPPKDKEYDLNESKQDSFQGAAYVLVNHEGYDPYELKDHSIEFIGWADKPYIIVD
jgi:hypothetical protein